MLSGDVLDDLTRRTPAGMMVLATAWPSLSTEAKLQILQHYQAGFMNDAPDQLIAIAGRDSEPIVRYWATRYWRLPDRASNERNKAMFGGMLGASEDALSLAEELRRDPSPLVAISAQVPRGLLAEPPSDAHHSVRQLFLLDARGASFRQVVEWIENLHDGGLAGPEELRDLLWEFTESKWFLKGLSPDKLDPDGGAHYDKVKAGKKLWALTKKLPPAAAMAIAGRAPVMIERENVVLEVFKELPKNVQGLVLYRNEPGVEAVYKLVMTDPALKASLADELDRQARDDAEFGGYDEDQQRERDIATSPDKTALMARAILDLTKEVKELRAQVAEAAGKKRGFSG